MKPIGGEGARGGAERRGSKMLVAELLEAGMLVCFGLSWPMNAWKAWKARTAKGTSWQFLALICAGYACGIAAKLVLGTLNWVLAVYVLNCVFLAANWAVYFRNRKLDMLTAEARANACGQLPLDLGA